MSASLLLRFEDRAALEREHAENLAHGRAFVSGATGVPLFSACTLVLEHPESGETCEVNAQVVMVLDDGPMRGVAVQFADRSDEELGRVAAFISARPAENQNDDLLAELEDEDDELAEPTNAVRERQLRLRNLPLAERLRVARGPNMEERIQLERIYGTAVWEALLRNPKVTVPEVARIAKKGTISRPMLDLICDNEAWIHQSIVRRALLTNPRLSTDAAMKILRTLPTRELKLVPQQKSYPAAVRSAASRLLKA